MPKHRSKPGRGDSDGPQVTAMTDEDLLVHPEMIDTDQGSFEGRFRAEGCIKEGCSGQKPIDTTFENTSVDRVENPREMTTPAPEDVIPGMYPHRKL